VKGESSSCVGAGKALGGAGAGSAAVVIVGQVRGEKTGVEIFLDASSCD